MPASRSLVAVTLFAARLQDESKTGWQRKKSQPTLELGPKPGYLSERNFWSVRSLLIALYL
jgi:hypothetical protein